MIHTEEGVRFTTATEWIEWRDSKARLMRNLPEHHADLLGPWMLEELPLAKRSRIVSNLSVMLLTSEIVVWENLQWAAATNGAEAWNGVVTPSVPMVIRPQLWTWPGDRTTDPEVLLALGLDEWFDLTAMLVYPVRKHENGEIHSIVTGPPNYRRETHGQVGWATVLFYSPSHEWISKVSDEEIRRNPKIALDHIRMVDSIFPGDPIREPYNGIFACRAFMDLPIVQTQPVERSRQQIRLYERKNPGRCSSVQTVCLRRVVQSHSASVQSNRDYHVQWWVRGHWRRRAERWNKKDGPIWVNPHVKGPEAAPLKPITERLVRVNR